MADRSKMNLGFTWKPTTELEVWLQDVQILQMDASQVSAFIFLLNLEDSNGLNKSWSDRKANNIFHYPHNDYVRLHWLLFKKMLCDLQKSC